jgi:hypothetical protein
MKTDRHNQFEVYDLLNCNVVYSSTEIFRRSSETSLEFYQTTRYYNLEIFTESMLREVEMQRVYQIACDTG